MSQSFHKNKSSIVSQSNCVC